MNKPLYILSHSNYSHAIDASLPALKPVLLAASGKKIRRIDRLTQLALIGGFLCAKNHAPSANSGLYVSSIYGSINNTATVLEEIYQQCDLPRPLNFINTVSNAACFYLAQQLGLGSNNIFASRDYFTLEAGLKLASIDLSLNNISTAMVGLVCEVGSQLDRHRQRFNTPEKYDLSEGSHWLHISDNDPDDAAIARIITIKEPINENELLTQLSQYTSLSAQLGFSDNVSISTQQRIAATTALGIGSYKSKIHRHEFSSAMNIGGFLDSSELEQRYFLHIDANDQNQFSLLIIEKLDG